MPAIGAGMVLFLVVQALLAAFVYTEATSHGSRSPLVAALSVFVLGVAAAFVFDTVLGVVGAELLAVFLYVLLRAAGDGRAESA